MGAIWSNILYGVENALQNVNDGLARIFPGLAKEPADPKRELWYDVKELCRQGNPQKNYERLPFTPEARKAYEKVMKGLGTVPDGFKDFTLPLVAELLGNFEGTYEIAEEIRTQLLKRQQPTWGKHYKTGVSSDNITIQRVYNSDFEMRTHAIEPSELPSYARFIEIYNSFAPDLVRNNPVDAAIIAKKEAASGPAVPVEREVIEQKPVTSEKKKEAKGYLGHLKGKYKFQPKAYQEIESFSEKIAANDRFAINQLKGDNLLLEKQCIAIDQICQAWAQEPQAGKNFADFLIRENGVDFRKMAYTYDKHKKIIEADPMAEMRNFLGETGKDHPAINYIADACKECFDAKAKIPLRAGLNSLKSDAAKSLEVGKNIAENSSAGRPNLTRPRGFGL